MKQNCQMPQACTQNTAGDLTNQIMNSHLPALLCACLCATLGGNFFCWFLSLSLNPNSAIF